jgi:hypothetical protein
MIQKWQNLLWFCRRIRSNLHDLEFLTVDLRMSKTISPENCPGQENTLPLPSIFIVSLPRSLSTLIHGVVRGALGLQEPRWTTAGEILNVDRFVFLPNDDIEIGRKYISETFNPAIFGKMIQFMDQVVSLTGFAYKDVVQPFVVTEWLRQNQVHVIRIKRNVVDVAYSMLNKGWHYPWHISDQAGSLEQKLIRGLVRAERSLDSICAKQIHFDEMIFDEQPVRTALAHFYENVDAERVRYINDQFIQKRMEILSQRSTAKYQILKEFWREAMELDNDFKVWNGEIPRIDIESKSEKERVAIKCLINNEFLYHRIGYDCRVMSFLPDGKVAKGAADCEMFWDVVEEHGTLYLDIFSRTELTCRLSANGLGVWQGRWSQFEKMPVEVLCRWNERAGKAEDCKPPLRAVEISHLNRKANLCH